MILIYKNIDKVKPIGGPSGYLYNLNKGLSQINYDDVEFLPCQNSNVNNSNLKAKIKKYMPRFSQRIIDAYNISKKTDIQLHSTVDLTEYSAIHFHSTEELFQSRQQLKDFSGVIILTSHSPCARHVELIDSISTLNRFLFSNKLKKLEEMDRYAFDRADVIVFPCREAEEPYFNTWLDYKRIHERNKEKYRYLPTGIDQCFAKQTKDEIRKKYHIPKSAFVICYVGRHNAMKGYDDLKRIAKYLLDNDNVYFLIAGKEEPLKGLKNQRWIEVGWTNDPHSIINASDLFVLPNKETYFDLIMLEVLSLGQIVVASNTGGNKYFGSFKDTGIFLYDDIADAVKCINRCIDLDEKDRVKMKNNNLILFNNYFSLSVFTNNYINLINSISREKV